MNFKAFFKISEKNIKQNFIVYQSFDLSIFSQTKLSNRFSVKPANTENTTVKALKNNFSHRQYGFYI
jgi:hypothetical protein